MVLVLVFATAFVLALVLTPIAIRLSPRLGTMDRPAARRVHLSAIPRLGGLPLFVAFFAALGVSLIFPRTDPNELARLAGLFIGALLLFAVGAYDDHHELSPWPQLIAQTIAAAIAVASGVLIREVQNPFGGTLQFDLWLAVPFTLFWIVGMINTVNWLDGIDGLAGGVIAIAGVVLFIHAYWLGQVSIALLALALIGAVLGFLRYNFAPAKIIMGTAGALVLGYELGVLSIIGAARVAFALLVLGIPIIDVAWQIVSRVRAGKSPFVADRRHLHHRLLDAGLSQQRVVLLYYSFAALAGLLMLVLPLALYKLIALVIIGVGGVLLLVRSSQRTGVRNKTKEENRERVDAKPASHV